MEYVDTIEIPLPSRCVPCLARPLGALNESRAVISCVELQKNNPRRVSAYRGFPDLRRKSWNRKFPSCKAVRQHSRLPSRLCVFARQFLMNKLFLFAAFLACFASNARAATSLSAKTVAGTSSVAGAANTITIGFTCDTALAAGDTVTISGLTNLGDPDTGSIVLTGTDAALFSSNSVASRGSWTRSI